ncbi:DNA primase [Streptomyces vinaceus]|uniref:DNA primase n=1 Tax=Streptomyces vinaceus TaxID=1960 RepID=A0A5J6J744_STRVI|nr:bifunctional DNA primase/polymerase [Streptomyces vinaceus]QEV46640.1 DNA primase [Streptomyces vinaceus]GHE60190.1 DNA primase [Streptomyces vinaceus]
MREILGRRLQRLRDRLKTLRPAPGRSGDPALPLLDAALACAALRQWPVLPGVGRSGADSGRCACPDPDCAVPGAHPFDPGLLAATTDPRMVAWWWTNRPTAPVLLATGGSAPCAVSLPANAAARAVVRLDAQGMRLGPIVATPTRWALLVAPYSLERLGELLYAKDHVPSSLRFHGEGGYLLLPPSPASGGGQVRWERAPEDDPAGPAGPAGPDGGGPWLPEVEAVVHALVEASTGASGGGSRLAY